MKAQVTSAWKKQALLFSMIIMLAGLLFSRALLSSSLFLFAALSLVHKNIRSQLIILFTSPFLWGMMILFLVPFISGLWSEDVSKWSQIMRIKLPLVLLPACFAGLNHFKYKDWEKIAWLFLLVISIGIGWSLYQYVQDASSVHAGYLQSHIIKTPAGNDHVRFSLLVTIAVFTGIFIEKNNRRNFSKRNSFFLWILIAVFIIYLHILAVRIGLFCFYFGAFIFISWSLWNYKSKIQAAVILLLLLLLPVISWFVFPTFKNRISYLRYDLSFVKKDIYLQGSNDGNRFRSIKAGWDIQNKHPLAGVGFGDIETAANEWYRAYHPEVIPDDRILPSSEWMIYGAGVGWPGFLLFLIIMSLPFFLKRLSKNIFWWLINVCMTLSYLFDIGLEVQYGVFVHAFILLWWYQWLRQVPEGSNVQ